jgi:hypothetical protein
MKNIVKFLGVIVSVTIIGFAMTACPDGGGGGGGGGGGDPDLIGVVTIMPFNNVTTGTKLTATYAGTETITITLYQWKKDGANVGINSKEYTPSEAGSYTVTISASGYKSKTSSAVTVTGNTLLNFAGDVTISPTTNVITGMELAAAYSGSETVTLKYQWKRDDTNVGTDSNKYTPTIAGSYTVTVSATGYAPKISNAVTVTAYSGPSWTAVTNTGLSGTSYLFNVAWGKDKFVAVGGFGKMAYSSDGITWTAVSDSTFGNDTDSGISTITYGNDKFVAVGAKGKIATSPDGITWTAVSTNVFSYNENGNTYTENIQAIAYGGGKFVAISSSNGIFAYSSDGTNWTAVVDTTLASTFKQRKLDGITYGNGKFVVNSSFGKVVYSSDGINWTIEDDERFWNIDAIIWGGDKFVAVGSNNAIMYSSDGIDWTTVVPDKTFTDYAGRASVAYGNGKFVALSYDGKMATSPDGINWTLMNIVAMNNINYFTGITYDNGKFIAVTFNGKIAYFSDN